MENNDDQLNYINFNQDASCLMIGTEKGFKIFHTSPFKDSVERTHLGGIGIIEIIYKTNIFAIVGCAKNKQYTPNIVIIWDDYLSKVVTELKFKSDVKNIKLKRDKLIFILLETKIYVLSLVNFQILDTIDTFDNPSGLFTISTSQKNNVIAFPDKVRGYVNVKNYDRDVCITICCHESDVFFLSVNNEGTILATASDKVLFAIKKGTMIRLFSTETGEYFKELRRGGEKAQIYSISFSPNSKYLACSSDRGTVHIFSLYNVIEKLKAHKEESEIFGEVKGNPNEETCKENDEIKKNSKSFLSVFRRIIPLQYLTSEWSFSQFRIPETKAICSFGVNKNTLIAVTSKGVLYEAKIDTKNGGHCAKVNEYKLSLIGGK